MLRSIVFWVPLLLYFSSVSAQSNLVTYAGNNGKEAFQDIVQLSNGTFIVAGYAEDLNWVGSSVPLTQLPNPGLANAQGSNRYAFLAQFSADLQQMLQLVHFPQGAAEDIRFIKTTNVPGAETGTMYISGNTSDTRQNGGGYFIAKLNDNFVNGTPTACEWAFNIWAEGYVKENHPWDVDAMGRATYIRGQSHGYDWSSIHRLDEFGERSMVPNWRTHWKIGVGEYRGLAANYPNGGADSLDYSGLVLKEGRCELRSWTPQEYDAMEPDGNGGMRKGHWPLDVFYNSPCDPQNVSTSGPGYTGYNTGATSVHGGSAIVVDRRDGRIYLGFNVKSVLPGGNPDFEPAVVAFGEDGTMEWWSRLYHEITPAGDTVNSEPDQYIDGLAIDYSQPSNSGYLVVNARCHGNNTENLWEGNAVSANPTASSFQPRFTGNSGNIHISWLGKLALANGSLMHASYVAEYAEGANGLGSAHPDPNLDGWPNPNAGWPTLNTTRLSRGAVTVTADGSVCVMGVGRRTITTRNAYQKMVQPANGGLSCWNSFVRVYPNDLSAPKYSSLAVGVWDTLTQQGGDNTTLMGVFKTAQGLVAVGFHKEDNNNPGQAKGNDVPTTNVPVWGNAAPQNQSALLLRLETDSLVNPDDDPVVIANLLEASSLLDMEVYPNPSTGAFKLRLAEPGESTWELFDLTGRRMAQGQSEQQSTTLAAGQLAAGVYLLRVRQNGKDGYRRLIRN